MYCPEFILKNHEITWMPRTSICRALQRHAADGHGQLNCPIEQCPYTHMPATGQLQLAFCAFALRTSPHNLGLLWHLQPEDTGCRPLFTISSTTAQRVLQTRPFLTEYQWQCHRYGADIPSPPLQPTSLRSPHHSQTTTRLRPTSPIHYIKEKTYNTTVENTILDNRRPSQKHQLPIHERDHQSDLKQRQPCGLGLNHPRGTRWRTHPHGRHRRRHLSIMCIDKTAFHLPTSETSAQAYTRPNQTCTLPSQTLANAQNYQPIAITGSDGSYFIDDAPATFLQHLHHKNCHSPILPVLHGSSPATSFTNLAELKYKTSHQSSSTHLDNLGHIRLYEHAQQCRVSHSHRMR